MINCLNRDFIKINRIFKIDKFSRDAICRDANGRDAINRVSTVGENRE